MFMRNEIQRNIAVRDTLLFEVFPSGVAKSTAYFPVDIHLVGKIGTRVIFIGYVSKHMVSVRPFPVVINSFIPLILA
jgi:hypothetical protein